MSTTYEACLVIGLENSKVKYGFLKEDFLLEIDADGENPEDELVYDHIDALIFNCTGDWAYTFGDLGYEWFSGIKFKCEEGISEESLGDLILLKSNFQEKLNELTKGENLINFEIRVIKNVY